MHLDAGSEERLDAMRTLYRIVGALVLFVVLSVSAGGRAAENAQAARQDVIASRPQPTMSNSIGMVLVRIEPGEFFMGSMSREAIAAQYGGGQGDYAQEEPMRLVFITEGFWLGRTEVTRGQFRQFVEDTGYKTTADQRGYGGGITKEAWGWVRGLNWARPGIDQTDDHPVVQVSWFDATEFCRWLSQKEGHTYALPTEAQWAYACRAGGDTAFCWGDTVQGGKDYANMADESTQRWIRGYRDLTIDTSPWDDGYPTTAPVGRFRPNAWGLYDMHGNACEWCRDWYDHDFYGKSDGLDPAGPPTGVHRVLRGSSWVRHPRLCRSASRHSIAPTFRSVGRGFRVVLLVSPGK